ncbi:iron-containing redox enzyme family protein [Glycomyces sp. TRM65418]|uniref:3-oxoacyl-[acyl-carrier-protein] synthase III C-terminal domain-containing protein n=1 Tax=Glycomyces sp. TRM65418 TaxID=2867006 RepID=UPI001CE54A19|nr:3-oxoacyl-[acyl-carrier-protein] synthase III C-terminal domain-containing protein [Glycomyces sp. TRM65418]MCC3763081.1 iron-containing redox enzyme family protein [Glycomyces sp. TRM65418]QZD57092.1 iron-containing redox enzyme family protein [Glycomyces sp. TRM65418]
MNAFITAAGAYLPGPPVGNDEIAALLGGVDERGDRLRRRVLAANGIAKRHYALDAQGRTTELNEELAANALRGALGDRGVGAADLDMLATATTQGDLLVPGFASMVHGRLGGGPMQLLSAGGVCASGLAALDAAVAKVRLGDRRRAAVVGSELSSRWLRGSHFGGVGGGDGDAHFLRWMLSDGAGAVLVEARPRPDRPSLRVDWVRTVSLAHEHPVCMRAGMAGDPVPAAGRTWQDLGSAAAAEQAGMMLLRQDTSALPALADAGLQEFARLAREGLIDLERLDHVLCHYSTNAFRDIVFDRLAASGAAVDTERWFSNLETRGNTGAASIFIALEECWRTGRFEPGQTVLLAVPESGRFSFAFAHLTCVDAEPAVSRPVAAPAAAPESVAATVPTGADVHARLDAVWQDFERRLDQVPVMRRLAEGAATIEDYRRLLFNLRQQVADGARWISRAASNFSVDLFDLRSAAIAHAAEEHRDFMMIERDYAACGGSIEDIRSGEKNIGSEALSAYMFHSASGPDPIGLLGAMFVIEGLGTGKAAGWAARFKELLGLRDDQVSFLAYHGEADDDHFAKLQAILSSPRVDAEAADAIVKTAKVVARLYALQLEELDHV